MNWTLRLLCYFKCINSTSYMAPDWWSIVVLVALYKMLIESITYCGKPCFASSKFTFPNFSPTSSTLPSSHPSRTSFYLYDSLTTPIPAFFIASPILYTLLYLLLSSVTLIVLLGTGMSVGILLTCIVTTSVPIVLPYLPAHYPLLVIPWLPSNLLACLFCPSFSLISLFLPFRFKLLCLMA